MTKRISDHAAAGKLIRAELKKQGIKASVRGQSYSGGDSITVRIDVQQADRVLVPAAQEAIQAFCRQFEMGTFNGMEDIYEYTNRNDDLPQVKFVFVQFEYGDLEQKASDFIHGLFVEGDITRTCPVTHRQTVFKMLRRDEFGFYRQFKQRVKVAA